MSNNLNFTARGSGRSFVFQHGLGSRIAQPQGLLADLAGVRLISVDCPGHGQSALPSSLLPSFDHYTDRVIEVIDALGIDSAVWGGISMGAGISLNAALRHSSRVQALILVRPAWLDEKTPDNLKILVDAARLIAKDGGRQQFEKLPQFTAIRDLLPNAAKSVLGVFAPEQRREIPKVLEAMVNDCPFPDLRQLERLQLPTLIIGNHDDPLHPFEMAEKLAGVIPGSRLEQVISRYVDDAAHREHVREIVTDFLSLST